MKTVYLEVVNCIKGFETPGEKLTNIYIYIHYCILSDPNLCWQRIESSLIPVRYSVLPRSASSDIAHLPWIVILLINLPIKVIIFLYTQI